MKILFITPPMGSWVTHGNHKAPNQYYAQLAAYVRQKGLAAVQVLDCKAEEVNYDQMIERVKEIKPDLVVFGDLLHSTGGLAVIWHFNESARRIKEVLPKTKTVMGGLWYSALFTESMEEYPQIDFILIGEGELTLTDLLKALLEGKNDFAKIPGLVSRSLDGKIVAGPHRGLIPDLNALPMPAYDLFPMDKYVGHTYWKPFAELLASRGCPGGCYFCYEWSLYDPRSNRQDFTSWRGLSAHRIVDELELLEKKYGTQVVVFQDDAFNVDSQVMKEFCEEKIRRGNQIKWVCLGRADDWTKPAEHFSVDAESRAFYGACRGRGFLR